MTEKIMELADAYAECRGHSEYVHCRAALAAAIKAEQDYTAAVISERDAFCTEADVLRMALTAMTSERDHVYSYAQACQEEADGLRKAAQMAFDTLEGLTGGEYLSMAGDITGDGWEKVDACVDALTKELNNV